MDKMASTARKDNEKRLKRSMKEEAVLNDGKASAQASGTTEGTWNQVKKKAKRLLSQVTGLDNVKKHLRSCGKGSTSCETEIINGMKVMRLPLKQEYENKKARVRVCSIGNPNIKREEKTIMMVGATGTGKSTLIDGLCNYIFGVKWDEPTRLQLIDEHADEKKNKSKGQSVSQTEWITVYRIASDTCDRLSYTLNLIDTPGFGDTRGISRDQELVEQIRALFGNPKEYGIDSLDAVCFLAKAPDARLTHKQKYIFHSILSIFGNDIGENILVMVTFADGAKSPVLEAIKAANMPHRKVFKFNNSALFANNGKQGTSLITDDYDTDDDSSQFSEMFWNMGHQSFSTFFNFLKNLESKSLHLTKEVLEQRRNLQDTLCYLEEKVHEGLAKMSELKTEERIFKENEDEIKRNANFTYVVNEVRSRKVDCPSHRHVTHCMNCHSTCHDDCAYRDDADKAGCVAMDSTGNCMRCEKKCHWSDHKNSGYYLVTEIVPVEKTYEDKLKKYQEATGERLSHISVLEMMQAEYAQIRHDVEQYVTRCRDILQRLREIALKPDPLTEIEYIEMIIQAEREEHKPGYEDRIRELQDIKAKAQRLHDVHHNKDVLPSYQSPI